MKANVPSGIEYLHSGIEVYPMGTPLIDVEEVSEDQIYIFVHSFFKIVQLKSM